MANPVHVIIPEDLVRKLKPLADDKDKTVADFVLIEMEKIAATEELRKKNDH